MSNFNEWIINNSLMNDHFHSLQMSYMNEFTSNKTIYTLPFVTLWKQ